MKQFSRKRIQDDVDTPAGRLAHHAGQEAGVPRREDARRREAESVNEVLPLLAAAHRGIDLGDAQHVADIQGGQANAAAGRVDQHALAALEPGEVHEAVDDGRIDARHARRVLEAQAFWDLNDARRGRLGHGRVRVRTDAYNAVADGEVGDLGPDGADYAR